MRGCGVGLFRELRPVHAPRRLKVMGVLLLTLSLLLFCRADVSDCSGPPLGNKTHEAMEFVFPGIGRLEAAGVETEWGSFSCSRETRMSAAAVHAMPAANENGG